MNEKVKEVERKILNYEQNEPNSDEEVNSRYLGLKYWCHYLLSEVERLEREIEDKVRDKQNAINYWAESCKEAQEYRDRNAIFLKEAEAKIKDLEEEVKRLQKEIEIRQKAVDRWVPCPDHRDKTERGKCYVCENELLKASLKREREGIEKLITSDCECEFCQELKKLVEKDSL